MSFTYCKSCGHKNLYSLQVPKFCGSCGQEMGGLNKALPNLTKVRASNKRTPPQKVNDQIDDQDGEDIFEVPEVKNFKCTFSSESSSGRKIKLADLVPNLEDILGQDNDNEKEPSRK